MTGCEPPAVRAVRPFRKPLLQLLLGAQLRAVTTLALTAVCRTRRQTGVALTADLLLTVVLAGQHLERGLNDTTTQAKLLVYYAGTDRSTRWSVDSFWML